MTWDSIRIPCDVLWRHQPFGERGFLLPEFSSGIVHGIKFSTDPPHFATLALKSGGEGEENKERPFDLSLEILLQSQILKWPCHSTTQYHLSLTIFCIDA